MMRILDPASKMKHETRILLLRHAETSAPDLFHGAESDIGLGERGHLQAETVAQTLAALGPDALYCSISRPNRPLRGILRNTSPIEMWMKLGSWPSTAPCVPLPLPGIPNRRMERYL